MIPVSIMKAALQWIIAEERQNLRKLGKTCPPPDQVNLMFDFHDDKKRT
jgi:hypothetical protein